MPRLSGSLIVYAWHWKFKWIKRVVPCRMKVRLYECVGGWHGSLTIPWQARTSGGSLLTKTHKHKTVSTLPGDRRAVVWKTCWFNRTATRPNTRYSLSHKTLGHNAELPSSVLNQVAILGHHHVVELLPFLCNHHVGITLHAQFETYEKDEKQVRSMWKCAVKEAGK